MTLPVKRAAAVLWRTRAFDGEWHHRVLEKSARLPTIAEIVASIPDLPRGFMVAGEVRINGDLIPRGIWHLVRPRYIPGRDTLVSLHIPLGDHGSSGGSSGGGGGKNPIALVASIAVLLVATAISGGALGPAGLGLLGASFASGGLGAIALGAAVGIGGALAVAALVPPPSLSNPLATASGGSPIAAQDSNSSSAAALTGNVLSPGSPMPRVMGTMRVFPQLLTNALIEVVGDVEYGEAVFGLAGPHDISSVRVGDTEVNSIQEVDIQIVGGKPGDAIQTLVQRQSFTNDANATLAGHVLNPTTQNQLLDQTNPASDTPQPQPFISRQAPDEIWVNLQWPEGMFNETDTTIVVNQAFRVQIRRRGTVPWINLPEVHFSMNKPGAFQKVIRVVFGAIPQFPNTPPTNGGPVYIFKTVPGQNGTTVTPATAGWTADASFSAGAGNDLLSNATFGNSNVKNVELYQDKVIFYLDPIAFPQDFYEIQVVRSHAYNNANLTAATYTWVPDSKIYDFFNYFLSGGIASINTDQKPYHAVVVTTRVSSIWNQNPIQSRDFSTVSVRVHSRALDALSVLGSGLVPDWDGANWSGLNITSNPAPHFRDVLTGNMGSRPVDKSVVTDSELVAWRARCISDGLTVNAIIEGKTYNDALLVSAGAGYARFRHNESYGVFQDKDRSGDIPQQVFTPRNMNNFKWTRAFADLPTGIRANFVDADNNYDVNAEVIVYDNMDIQDASQLSQVTYDGLVHRSDVIKRARFDLSQAKLRFTFYQGDTDAESLTCQRGDLAAIQHDVLVKQAGFSRIVDVSRNASGNVVGVNLDGSVPINTTTDFFADANIFAEPDVFVLGQKTGMAIRLKNGNGVLVKEVTASANGDQTAITFVTPFVDPGPSLDNDCLVAVGPLGSEYKRLIVFAVAPSGDSGATLTFIDEAPSLFPLG